MSCIDEHIGARLRLRRLSLGLEPALLAAALRVSPERIERYEAGTEGIRAAELHSRCRLLEVPVSYFFESLDGREQGLAPVLH